MKLIKLTDENGQTYNHTQWGEGVTHSVEWSGWFCSAGCIHVYQDLHVGLFMTPVHANFSVIRAWEAEGDVLLSDKGLKFGVASLTINKEIIPLPLITVVQRVAFGIYSTLDVKQDDRFVKWANNWFNGKDRSFQSARATAADAAATYTAAAAAYAAHAAYAAADAAAAAATADAAHAAYAAADAAAAAARAAYAAADAAAAAAHAAARAKIINFATIAKNSMEII
jgi:hypothetical protein